MYYRQLPFKRIFTTLAVSSILIGGAQAITSAQSNPGLTIFSGVERENILNYHLDYGGHAGGFDRYRFRVPAKKMTQGAAKFFIAYPDYYKGKFNTDEIEVRIKGQKEPVPLREVVWDKESRIIEIDLEQPIRESKKVEIVFSGVKNPRFGGTYYFHCQVLPAGDLPIRQHLGTWILSIGN